MNRILCLSGLLVLLACCACSDEPQGGGAEVAASLPRTPLAVDRLLAAEDFYSAASLSIAKGDWGTAIARLGEALKLDPSHRAALNFLALSTFSSGDVEGALTEYARGLERFPDDYYLRIGSAFAHFESGDIARATSDFVLAVERDLADHGGLHEAWFTWSMKHPDAMDAVEAYSARLEAHPTEALTRFLRANAVRAAGDIETATSEYKDIVHTTPTFALAHMVLAVLTEDAEAGIGHATRAMQTGFRPPALIALRGRAQERWGKLAQAESDYTQALRFDADCSAALLSLANLHFRRGQRTQARADFLQAVKVDSKVARATGLDTPDSPTQTELESAVIRDPNDALAWHLLGNRFEGEGDLSRAAKSFLSAIEADPTFIVARAELARLERRRGFVEDSLALLDERWLVPGNLAYAWQQRGWTLLRLELFDAAEDAFSKAIELAPLDAELFSGRGRVRLLAGDLEGAIRDLTFALRERNPVGADQRARGEARLRRGDPVGARLDFDLSIGLDPTDARALALRAKTFLDEGKKAEAVSDLMNALRVSPSGDLYDGALRHLVQLDAIEPCDVCNGARILDCVTCDGAGREGEHDCVACETRGTFLCGNCTGTGVRQK